MLNSKAGELTIWCGMNTIEGNLTMLGNSEINNKATKYSVIEIGERTLQKIMVPNPLDNYLRRALDQNGPSKLFLNGKVLAGLQLPDGKIYCYKAKLFAAIVLIVLGIPTIAFFGLGLLFIWQGYSELKNYGIMKDLQLKGATALSL